MSQKEQKAEQSPLSVDAYAEYLAVFGTLSIEQQEMLRRTVKERRITRASWRDALESWKLCGYSPRNIAGIVEYAQRRPAGKVGTVVNVSVPEQPEPEMHSVAVRPPERLFSWDSSL